MCCHLTSSTLVYTDPSHQVTLWVLLECFFGYLSPHPWLPLIYKNHFYPFYFLPLLISADASFCDRCSVLNTSLPLLTEMMHNELKATINIERHFSLPMVIESPRNVQVLGNLDRLGVCNNWGAVISTARTPREGTAEVMLKDLI